MSTTATLYQAVVIALSRADLYNQADTTVPAAVLWTDGTRQWEALLPRLRDELVILTLGPYDPSTRTGPAIWLKCMIARSLPGANWPEGTTPIIYLPGISRQELRAVDECPRAIKSIAELQYRGVLWTHKNGRDWTIAGFLQASEDVQIEVAADNDTREALHRSLLKLVDEPVASLRSEAPLTSVKLNGLLNPEPVRNLLKWMDDPATQRGKLSDSEWAAFRATCQRQFNFDPVADGEVTAAIQLGKCDGIWQSVWHRFAEAPRRYPNLPGLLRRARPSNTDLLHVASSWPQDNDAEEASLRDRLIALKNVVPAEARKEIRLLEQSHGLRRGWVWAEIGLAPLATVLPTLLTLANVTKTAIGGLTPMDAANAYVSDGWRADVAVLDALAILGNSEDVNAVKGVINVLYTPWLSGSSEAFQQAMHNHPLSAPPNSGTAVAPKPGCCWLFADGLRYDVGQRLAEALEQTGLLVQRDWQWAAIPTVTATAKPAVSPVASLLGPGSDFNCVVRSDGVKVVADTLRRELTRAGYSILTKDDTGNPTGAAWTEFGSLDATGHNAGWKLALRIPEEIKEIAGRVKALIHSGWSEVRIVTDHGWLLLPSGLPKVDLPEHLTEFRKGRCARLKDSASSDQQTIPWRWNQNVRVATPPGIGCYVTGQEYEHGGLSPQECITPILTITSMVPTGPTAAITSVKWTGMRCRVHVSGASANTTLDLRTKPADAATSLIANPKIIDTVGQASVAVPDDSREGEAAVVVLLGPGGNVLSQLPTIVGKDS